jgi:hypothetical protein
LYHPCHFPDRLLGHKGHTRIGLVYAYEHDKTSAEMVGMPDTVRLRFNANSLTGGISYDPRLGSTLFYNHQTYKLKGGGLRTNRPISYTGITQFLSPQWLVRYVRVGTGDSFSVGYLSKEWEGYLSVTERAFSQAEDIYGRGFLIVVSVVKKF